MKTGDEMKTLTRFEAAYAIPLTDVAELVERRVIGASWGANGYTTVAQADALRRRLRLAPGARLLDVGTGRGWPGLYLGATSGCAVVGTDVPFAALATARIRAGREHLAERFAAAVAAADALPFPPGSFDAVVHTDVLC